MIIRLTKAAVDALQVNEKRYSGWFDKFPGFGVRVTPNGVKTFVYQYVSPTTGQRRNYTIGKYGPITLAEARGVAERLRGQVANGQDPQAEKNSLRKSLTVSELCDHYLESGCSHKKPSTIKTDKGRIERHIKPLIGNKKVHNVSIHDVQMFFENVKNGKSAKTVKTKKFGKAVVRGGEGTARRTVGLLGGIFSFAVKRRIISENPVKGVERGKDGSCERFLSTVEMKSLFTVLDEVESSADEKINPMSAIIVRLLIFTGARKGEILNLTWDEVDLENGFLHLKDSKSGSKKIPLSDEAMDVISSIIRISGSPYVFPGRYLNSPFQGLQKEWDIIRKRACIPDVRLHDLRHTFVSIGYNNGIPLEQISRIVGHKDVRTTQRYAHLLKDTAKTVAGSISGSIASFG